MYSLILKFSGCPGNRSFSGIIILLYSWFFFSNSLHQFLEKSPYFERNGKYTRFVCFGRWLLRYDHISTRKLLLNYWKSIFYLEVVYIIYQYIFILAAFIIVSRRYERHYLDGSRDILFYIMFHIINPVWLRGAKWSTQLNILNNFI